MRIDPTNQPPEFCDKVLRLLGTFAVLLAMLLASTAASAQVPSGPTCWPKPFGTGSEMVVRTSQYGMAYGWLCDTLTEQRRVIVAGRWQIDYDPTYLSTLPALANQGPEQWAALWTARVKRELTDPALAPVFPLIEQVRTALPGQAFKFVVAPNGAYTTRPAYPFAAGARSATSNGRATVGAACDCAAASAAEKRSIYCGVNGRADQVALCVRAP